jgi:hypothetical protein
MAVMALYQDVDASTKEVRLIAANANRLSGSVILNDSDATLYLKLGAGVSNVSFVEMLLPRDKASGRPAKYNLPDAYTGDVYGVWNNRHGTARITQILRSP